jgi:hypothetical protein
MKKQAYKCDSILLSRFFDGEIGLDEQRRLNRHLKECPECRKDLRDYTTLSRVFKKGLEEELEKVDFNRLEASLLARTATKKISRLTKFQDLFVSRKLLIPAATFAAVMVISLTIALYFAPSPRPSAIIKSFTGDISSVMIIETPASRQMIIWYKEISMNGGNKDGSKEVNNAVDFVCSNFRAGGIGLGRA